ncbi:hypothetical protein FRC18_001330 [Serendipita sp. 400]|nr:hypothetical protein FRC18_001330 [Serendipita sp. 400]
MHADDILVSDPRAMKAAVGAKTLDGSDYSLNYMVGPDGSDGRSFETCFVLIIVVITSEAISVGV